MWQIILIGDLLIMGFMIFIVAAMSFKINKKAQDDYMKIPLEDS